MVGERLDLNMEEAFTTLRAYARGHNRRLVDVAYNIIDGTLTTTALTLRPPQEQS